MKSHDLAPIIAFSTRESPLSVTLGRHSPLSSNEVDPESWPWYTETSMPRPDNQSTKQNYAVTWDKTEPKSIRLCSKGLTRLTDQFVQVAMHSQTILICCNALRDIPVNIGVLSANLKVLSLEKNKLKHLPDTIGLLTNLEELRLKGNDLMRLPDSIGNLRNLKVLDVSFNALRELTPFIGQLESLERLDLSTNQLRFLPAEISRLKQLRRFKSFDCEFVSALPPRPSMAACQTQTLKELAARALFRHFNTIPDIVPPLIVEYMQQVKFCTFCHGPWFENNVYRYAWWSKDGTDYPVYHRLCSEHWSTDEERLIETFSSLAFQLPLSPKKKMEASSSYESVIILDDLTSSRVSLKESPPVKKRKRGRRISWNWKQIFSKLF